MRTIRIAVRGLLLAMGIVLCAVGVSAASKLFGETLDSPRWVIGGLALLALGVGLGAIGLAVRFPRSS